MKLIPKILLLCSALFLIMTCYLFISYGQDAYFAIFHHPFNANIFGSHKTYAAPKLPVFKVQPSISSNSVSIGDTQNIHLAVTSDKNVTGYLEVWIWSPRHKEVFKSNIDHTDSFKAGQTAMYNFGYQLPDGSMPGVYSVSTIITSVDQKTDYYVNENFASFKIAP